VPDQNDVVEVLELENGANVGDERGERDLTIVEVVPFAEARQRRRPHLMPVVAQDPGRSLPAPTSVTTAVHQHEGHRLTANHGPLTRIASADHCAP
jgi:hypothetical protein